MFAALVFWSPHVKGGPIWRAVEFCFVSFYVLVFCTCMLCLARSRCRDLSASQSLFVSCAKVWHCCSACEGSWCGPLLKAAPTCAEVSNTGRCFLCTTAAFGVWSTAVFHWILSSSLEAWDTSRKSSGNSRFEICVFGPHVARDLCWPPLLLYIDVPSLCK